MAIGAKSFSRQGALISAVQTEINSKVAGAEESADISLRDTGLSGDISATVSPATDTPAPTSEAWTYTVTVTLKNTAGTTHSWYSGTQSSVVSAGDTSTAGTATVSSADLEFTNGVATVDLEGDAADWLDTETATLTVGNLSILGYTISGGTTVLTFTAA